MFLYSEYMILKNRNFNSNPKKRQSGVFILNRKEMFSPRLISILQGIRAFFLAPLKASCTVEAALVLPLFLFVMVSVLQYGILMETAVKFGTAMTETGKSMAVSAYVSKYGGDTDKVKDVAVGVLTAAYAHNKIMSRAGDTPGVKNANMALSSFLKEDEMIDLILTYQIRSPIASVKLLGNFFIQRLQVRAWTGRSPHSSDGQEHKGEDNAGTDVYVTATGQVYHTDEECTHLKLSVREVSMKSLDILRNGGGSIYHACESCGDHAGTSVYITNHGNRYHSTLSCSRLKRTVKKVSKEEVQGMRMCSKCGG